MIIKLSVYWEKISNLLTHLEIGIALILLTKNR